MSPFLALLAPPPPPPVAPVFRAFPLLPWQSLLRPVCALHPLGGGDFHPRGAWPQSGLRGQSPPATSAVLFHKENWGTSCCEQRAQSGDRAVSAQTSQLPRWRVWHAVQGLRPSSVCQCVVAVGGFGNRREEARTQKPHASRVVPGRLTSVQPARSHHCAAAAAPDHQARHLHCYCPCDHLDLPAARGADSSRRPPDPGSVCHQRGRPGSSQHVHRRRAGRGHPGGCAGPS